MVRLRGDGSKKQWSSEEEKWETWYGHSKETSCRTHDEVVFEAMDDTIAEEGFPNNGRNVFPLDQIDEPDVCTFCDDGVA